MKLGEAYLTEKELNRILKPYKEMTAKETERLAIVETKIDGFFAALNSHMNTEDNVLKSVAAVLVLGLGAIVWLFIQTYSIKIDMANMKSDIASEVVKQLDARWMPQQ